MILQKFSISVGQNYILCDKNYIPVSAVTILKSKLKIVIFCQNRPKSKSLHLLSHVSISSRFDFLQQLMDVTGLKDYNFRRFQTDTASILNTD